MSDTDLELLERYTLHQAEDAFAELVQRHLGLVHSAALRQVRSTQLAATISAAVTLAAGTAVGSAAAVSATTAKTIAMTTLQKTFIAGTLAAAIGTGLYEAREAARLRRDLQALLRAQAPLSEQVNSLRRERDDAVRRLGDLTTKPTPRLPAPPMQATAAVPEDVPGTSVYERVYDKDLKLTPDKVEPYLKANGRNAASLLAAFRTTGDPALLEEAMRKFPADPQVAFEAVFKKDATREERRRWLDAFKESDRENALANYLSALDHFRSGETDQAVQEFIAASGKPFQDYTSERYQDDTEAYLGAGYSVADAKAASGLQLLLPQLAQMKELGLDMIELAKSYREAGDDASAQAALGLVVQLGQRYGNSSPGEAGVSQLVGIALEGRALTAMDPNTPWGSNGQTVQNRLDQLKQQRTELEERYRRSETLLPVMTEQDWVIYRDRWLMFGEEAAVKWLINKHGEKP